LNKTLQNLLAGNIVPVVIVGLAVVFYILTIRPGHNWGGDFALYIQHAINIVTGAPYADSGYVLNPADLYLSPHAYPPVFPLFLAPVYQFFCIDIHAMKIAGIMVFAVFLLLFAKYARNRLQSPLLYALLLAALAFSPSFWESKDRILPDYLFILLFYATVMIVDRLSVTKQPFVKQLPTIFLAALFVCLVYGTRSLGLLIVPALLFHDVVRFRRISGATVIIAILFAFYYFAQNAALEIDKSYFEGLVKIYPEMTDAAPGVNVETVDTGWLGLIKDNISILDDRIPGKLHSYARILGEYWYIGERHFVGFIVLYLMTAIAIAGFISKISRSPSFGDYVVLTYAVVLLVVPFQQDRYILPLIPLYLLYIFHGLELVYSYGVRKGGGMIAALSRTFPVMVCLVMIAAYTSSYAYSQSGNKIARGVASAESGELFEYIRENTPEQSLLVFHKPRPLALFTGRRAMGNHWQPDLDKLWHELNAMGATHIVLASYIDPAKHPTYFLRPMSERYSGNMELAFRNRHYIVYAIKGAPADQGGAH
jgi:hypothetical protein